jgi:hypothetical protein
VGGSVALLPQDDGVLVAAVVVRHLGPLLLDEYLVFAALLPALLSLRGPGGSAAPLAQASQSQNACTLAAQMLNFAMCQSGVGFKSPYSNRPFEPLNPPNQLHAIFVSWYKGSQNPLIN